MSRDIYRDHPQAYAEFAETTPPNALYDRPTILRLAGDLDGRRVLELGCAGGGLTERLVERGADVLALDGERLMVAIARDRLGDRARIEVADLEQPLDLVADASVDVVTASLVLHYVEDWAPLLGELHRALAPGGRLVFSIQHPITAWELSDRTAYHDTELIQESWHWTGMPVTAALYRRPFSAIVGSLRDAGFAIDRIEEPIPDLDGHEVEPAMARVLRTAPVFLFVSAIAEDG